MLSTRTRSFLLVPALVVVGLVGLHFSARPARAEINLLRHTGDPHPDPQSGAAMQKFEFLHLNDFDTVAYLGRSDYFGDFDDPSIVEIMQQSALGGFVSIAADVPHNYDALDFANGNRVVFKTPDGIYRNAPSAQPSEPFYQQGPGQIVGVGGGGPLDRNVTYGNFYDSFERPVINNHADVAFTVGLEGRTDGGLFRSEGLRAFTVALGDDVAPGANADYGTFEDLAMNDDRQITAIVNLRGASVDATNSRALYFFDHPQPGQTAHLIARQGQASPARPSYHFTDFSTGPSIDPDAKVYFTAGLEDTSGNTSSGAFVYDGGNLQEIVSEGDPLPDGSGDSFQALASTPQPGGGKVLLYAQVGNPIVSSDALYLKDQTGLHEVMREGDSAPNGDGRFSHVQQTGISDAGEVVFKVGLLGTSQPNIIDDPGPNEAIYFHDDDGHLTEIIREGQQFLGATVERLFLAEGSPNDDGRVAFTFRLNVIGGFEGIAVWTEGTINHVSNGHFENRDDGLAGWTRSGAGTAQVSSGGGGDRQVQMTSGSPVSLTQQVDTPEGPVEILFDFQFVDGQGELIVLLDQMELARLKGEDYGQMDRMEKFTIRPAGKSSLKDVPLTFTFDADQPGQQLNLDDVSLRIVPEPTTVCLLMLGTGLALLRKRGSSRAASGR